MSRTSSISASSSSDRIEIPNTSIITATTGTTSSLEGTAPSSSSSSSSSPSFVASPTISGFPTLLFTSHVNNEPSPAEGFRRRHHRNGGDLSTTVVRGPMKLVLMSQVDSSSCEGEEEHERDEAEAAAEDTAASDISINGCGKDADKNHDDNNNNNKFIPLPVTRGVQQEETSTTVPAFSSTVGADRHDDDGGLGEAFFNTRRTTLPRREDNIEDADVVVAGSDELLRRNNNTNHNNSSPTSTADESELEQQRYRPNGRRRRTSSPLSYSRIASQVKVTLNQKKEGTATTRARTSSSSRTRSTSSGGIEAEEHGGGSNSTEGGSTSSSSRVKNQEHEAQQQENRCAVPHELRFSSVGSSSSTNKSLVVPMSPTTPNSSGCRDASFGDGNSVSGGVAPDAVYPQQQRRHQHHLFSRRVLVGGGGDDAEDDDDDDDDDDGDRVVFLRGEDGYDYFDDGGDKDTFGDEHRCNDNTDDDVNDDDDGDGDDDDGVVGLAAQEGARTCGVARSMCREQPQHKQKQRRHDDAPQKHRRRHKPRREFAGDIEAVAAAAADASLPRFLELLKPFFWPASAQQRPEIDVAPTIEENRALLREIIAQMAVFFSPFFLGLGIFWIATAAASSSVQNINITLADRVNEQHTAYTASITGGINAIVWVLIVQVPVTLYYKWTERAPPWLIDGWLLLGGSLQIFSHALSVVRYPSANALMGMLVATVLLGSDCAYFMLNFTVNSAGYIISLYNLQLVTGLTETEIAGSSSSSSSSGEERLKNADGWSVLTFSGHPRLGTTAENFFLALIWNPTALFVVVLVTSLIVRNVRFLAHRATFSGTLCKHVAFRLKRWDIAGIDRVLDKLNAVAAEHKLIFPVFVSSVVRHARECRRYVPLDLLLLLQRQAARSLLQQQQHQQQQHLLREHDNSAAAVGNGGRSRNNNKGGKHSSESGTGAIAASSSSDAMAMMMDVVRRQGGADEKANGRAIGSSFDAAAGERRRRRRRRRSSFVMPFLNFEMPSDRSHIILLSASADTTTTNVNDDGDDSFGAIPRALPHHHEAPPGTMMPTTTAESSTTSESSSASTATSKRQQRQQHHRANNNDENLNDKKKKNSGVTVMRLDVENFAMLASYAQEEPRVWQILSSFMVSCIDIVTEHQGTIIEFQENGTLIAAWLPPTTTTTTTTTTTSRTTANNSATATTISSSSTKELHEQRQWQHEVKPSSRGFASSPAAAAAAAGKLDDDENACNTAEELLPSSPSSHSPMRSPPLPSSPVLLDASSAPTGGGCGGGDGDGSAAACGATPPASLGCTNSSGSSTTARGCALACCTALRVVARARKADHGISLDVRLGLHHGPAMIGSVGGGATATTSVPNVNNSSNKCCRCGRSYATTQTTPMLCDRCSSRVSTSCREQRAFTVIGEAANVANGLNKMARLEVNLNGSAASGSRKHRSGATEGGRRGRASGAAADFSDAVPPGCSILATNDVVDAAQSYLSQAADGHVWFATQWVSSAAAAATAPRFSSSYGKRRQQRGRRRGGGGVCGDADAMTFGSEFWCGEGDDSYSSLKNDDDDDDSSDDDDEDVEPQAWAVIQLLGLVITPEWHLVVASDGNSNNDNDNDNGNVTVVSCRCHDHRFRVLQSCEELAYTHDLSLTGASLEVLYLLDLARAKVEAGNFSEAAAQYDDILTGRCFAPLAARMQLASELVAAAAARTTKMKKNAGSGGNVLAQQIKVLSEAMWDDERLWSQGITRAVVSTLLEKCCTVQGTLHKRVQVYQAQKKGRSTLAVDQFIIRVIKRSTQTVIDFDDV